MKALIYQSLYNARAAIDMVLADQELMAMIEMAARQCVDALTQGKKILLAGNGGSAACAQHLACELTGRFHYDRPGLAAIALSADTVAMTAIGNDYGFDQVFARQLLAIGHAGDVLIALSTSGKSPNILAALEAARAHSIITIGMTGKNGGDMALLCDYLLCVPSVTTAHIQEIHSIWGHIVCRIIEERLCGDKYRTLHQSA